MRTAVDIAGVEQIFFHLEWPIMFRQSAIVRGGHGHGHAAPAVETRRWVRVGTSALELLGRFPDHERVMSKGAIPLGTRVLTNVCMSIVSAHARARAAAAAAAAEARAHARLLLLWRRQERARAAAGQEGREERARDVCA